MGDDHRLHHEVDRLGTHVPTWSAFKFEEIHYTFGEFKRRTERVARVLDDRGLGPGDVLLAHSTNHVDLFSLFYACSRVGCTYTTLSTHQSRTNARYMAETLSPDIVCYSMDESITEGMLPTVREELPDAEYMSVDATALDGEATIEELVADVEAGFVERDLDGDVAHNVFWSSGTTSRPKAIVRNHADSLNFAKPLMETFPYRERGTRLLPRDMMYGSPYLQYGLPGLMNGEELVLLRSVSPAAIVDALEMHDVYVTSIGFTLANEVLDRVDDAFDGTDYAHMPIQSRGIANRLLGTVHDEIYHIFATMDAGLPLVEYFNQAEDADPPTLGRPHAGTTVRVVRPDADEAVPPSDTVDRGEPGELVVKGMTTLTRYVDDEVQDENVRDGFVYTGDLVVEDEDGRLQFLGRVDNRIRSGGVNVYPEHIERELETHPAVEAAVVVGVPDDTWGERIAALVVPAAGADDDDLAATLDQHCLDTERVSRQMRPKEYAFVDEVGDLPTAALGKYDRGAIIKRFQS